MEQRLAYANQSLIESILPILDNFDRALAQDSAKVDASTILKGVTLVSEQLKSLVGKYGRRRRRTRTRRRLRPQSPSGHHAAGERPARRQGDDAPAKGVHDERPRRAGGTGGSVEGEVVDSWWLIVDRTISPAAVFLSTIKHQLSTHSMPTYEYICDACGSEFEAFQSMSAAPIKKMSRVQEEQGASQDQHRRRDHLQGRRLL